MKQEEAARKIIDALVNRRAYVSAGTSAFPGGEIRGNFPAASAAEGPGPTPVPLPPGGWAMVATGAGLGAARVARNRFAKRVG